MEDLWSQMTKGGNEKSRIYKKEGNNNEPDNLSLGELYASDAEDEEVMIEQTLSRDVWEKELKERKEADFFEQKEKNKKDKEENIKRIQNQIQSLEDQIDKIFDDIYKKRNEKHQEIEKLNEDIRKLRIQKESLEKEFLG